MPDVPAGTITLLFTDIEGSTLLLQHVGEQYSHVLAQCRQLLRAAFQQSHGHEVDTQGDAFFFAFARATDAVSAAVAAQRALASHAWPDQATVRVRMGVMAPWHIRSQNYQYRLPLCHVLICFGSAPFQKSFF